ncbi:S8 family serine peptidase [Salipaludibacillus aurantiacus]|uniref:Thermitase n=1 Tax=Salipaludibacillus aurantiacus TaxID=1601833 RepID=A0A1H9QAW2_9BACI|nr:S8 family serine peptidase [Salipaludibacillus aurantiacus]SER57542.1 thermitase [Salipaludibacillus aurantiacus]
MREPGKLLICFKKNAKSISKDDIHKQVGTNCLKTLSEVDIDIVNVPEGEEEKFNQRYSEREEVDFVEYNYIRKPTYIPNDPYYSRGVNTKNDGVVNQWGLQRINPEGAFNKVKHLSPNKKIAILDTGIDPEHPDLASKITDGVNVGPGQPDDITDKAGHGTHVAGIAAALTDNETGIAGASFNTAMIIPVKMGDGWFTSESMIAGICYAIDKKADVINMSFGGPEFNRAEQLAVERAYKKGIVLVAATGNDGLDTPHYPAGYNYVLSVSATNRRNRLASFSNRAASPGISAPGTAILSTTPTYSIRGIQRHYDSLQGTSMAAPLVSGTAVMLKAVNPNASNAAIIRAIQNSARSITDSTSDRIPSFGLLDASNAARLI